MLHFNLKEVKNDKIKRIGNENYEGIDIFDAFESMRKIILDELFFCEYYNKSNPSSYQQMIFNLPPILIIFLDRGKNDRDFNEEFDFTEVLNFNHSNYVINEGSYKKYFLCGLIKYIGENSSKGHYISFCRNSMNEDFVMYNDELVIENIYIDVAMECKISDNKNEKVTPYILFYHYF